MWCCITFSFFFLLFWFVVKHIHDQIFFFFLIPKAEPVFAIINKLFIRSTSTVLRYTTPRVAVFAATDKKFYQSSTYQRHMYSCIQYMMSHALIRQFLKKKKFNLTWRCGVSIGQGVLYFPSASLSSYFKA